MRWMATSAVAGRIRGSWMRSRRYRD